MATYTVHAPRGEATPQAEALRLLFIKEGFCWPALFFAPAWLIFRRLWMTLLGYALVLSLIALAGRRFGPEAVGPATMLFAIWFALEANQLRRWTLERWGWRFVGVAVGRNRLEAEENYFRDLRPSPAPAAAAPSPPPAPARSSGVPIVAAATA